MKTFTKVVSYVAISILIDKMIRKMIFGDASKKDENN